ncbi:uncharacterized protein LOC111485102 isoform X1 [Cucurbita maxima]|uniref:Uncharacterized protein LOC111485102 isoform X1 n=2 Tax=Cucurbita maxima TaxID=3661 RepID=A0A6J1JJV7_CUCMA|nr:uncharacterized protein LOC111485102 isoform X1 [Cucurbita maxima]XP_022987583.1 uncharacterized protein LOC111485102 isoform X1 [Cucurbita maxima]
MLDILNRLEEINTLICSGVKANKSLAYSTLLQIQQVSTTSHTSIDALAKFSRDSIQRIVSDTQDEDEEIAAQALKCLGFIIYHPSIIAAIPAKEANFIFESLTELIIRTKLKSVCNLGVWCISIQQLDEEFLALHFHSLLLAVTHALDNPNGSLSTTFEAIQAITKLAAKLSDKMRESSNIWAPPVYRRLLSFDKRERDMSERCLLKIRSTILPPPLVLSKALVKDMKGSLLNGMDKLLNLGMKVQTIAAWGWFIRILGSHSMKNRNLVNKMLKIPERTFSDHDPQVQIASQVAWEGLIDALVHSPTLRCEINVVKGEENNQTVQILNGNDCEIQANAKSIKLIMVPLVGVMQSKCDMSVRLSCLNTWNYLLYKLDSFVNSPCMIKLVLEPILEAIFRLIPDNENIRLWSMCLSLLDDFLLAKCSHMDNDLTVQLCYKSEAILSEIEYQETGKRFWKQFPIKWLPWNLNQLAFHLKMICVISTSASMETFSNENRTFAYDTCQRLFKSVLKGVQLELKKPSANYDDVMLGLREILRFLRYLSDNLSGDGYIHHHLHYAILHFIRAVTKELEPAILGSPLYEVELDFKEMDGVQAVNHISYAQVLGVPSISYMDKVSPIVYLIVMYSSVAVQSTSTMCLTDCILKEMHEYFKLVFSSFIPPDSLLAAILILNKNIVPTSLRIWIAIAKGLMESSNMRNNIPLKTKSETEGVNTICYLLSYPFVVCSSKILCGSTLENLELESVVQVWKSLYSSVNTLQLDNSTSISFNEGLASMLSRCLNDQSMPGCGSESCSSCEGFSADFLSIFVDIVINILKGLQNSERRSNRIMREDSNCEKSCFNSFSLRLAARFIELLRIKRGKNSSHWLSRVFSALAQFVSCLHLKQDIFGFIEIISSPLLLWLTKMETLEEGINSQLQILWAEIISHLQRGCPSLVFDSAFLKLLAPLLEKTLDHPNSSISEPTITFWNSSFGEHLVARYPQNLLPILHKLSRNGRIKLQKRCLWMVDQCPARQEDANPPFSHRVSATSIRSSKRIELMTTTNQDKHKEDIPTSNSKRKKMELTQHQKEVRRAQQGRARDCGGHGPGIQTYTSLDFSQVVNDSGESQDTQII